MQVFTPYVSPLETAKCLDPKRLNRQIQEAKIIIDAIEGTGKGWFNHPIVKMYAPHRRWLKYYMKCLRAYRISLYESDHLYEPYPVSAFNIASFYNDIAVTMTPYFLTEGFCMQHRRRLYTKDKEYYKQFAEYGESEENWYCIGGEIVKYINGKRIE